MFTANRHPSEFLTKVACQFTYVGEVWNAQKKTYGVQDVGLAAAIQSSDGVEQWVEAVNLRPLRVGLEPLDNNRLDVHIQAVLAPLTPKLRSAIILK